VYESVASSGPHPAAALSVLTRRSRRAVPQTNKQKKQTKTGLQSLCLRQNLLPSGAWANRLASAPRLRDLELRDNALAELPPLSAGFGALERLDASYNQVRSALPLRALAPAAGSTLRELYMASNKIAALVVPFQEEEEGGGTAEEDGAGAAAGAAAAGAEAAAVAAAAEGSDDDDGAPAATTSTPTVSVLRGLTALTVLELGSNRIRRVEGLEDQGALLELWLGRNRIGPAVGPGLAPLSRLRRLSLQSNRLESMAGLGACPSLEELYLSHNGIRVLEGLDALPKLRVLDVSSNRLTALGGGGGGGGAGGAALAAQSQLEDLWLNDNAIDDFSRLREDLAACRGTLSTVYLDGNPAAVRWKAERRYRRELVGAGGGGSSGGDSDGPLLPALEQLDSDVLPEPGPKRDAWIASESAPGGPGRAMGREADLAAVRAAAAAAENRRAARVAQEAAAAAAAEEGGDGKGDAAPPGGNGGG